MVHLDSLDRHPRQSGDTAPLPTLRFVGPWKTIRPAERQLLRDVYVTRKSAGSEASELPVLVAMIAIAVLVIYVALWITSQLV